MKSNASWGLKPYSLVKAHRRFGGKYCKKSVKQGNRDKKARNVTSIHLLLSISMVWNTSLKMEAVRPYETPITYTGLRNITSKEILLPHFSTEFNLCDNFFYENLSSLMKQK
jgi:hypothetical protein